METRPTNPDLSVPRVFDMPIRIGWARQPNLRIVDTLQIVQALLWITRSGDQ